MRYPGGKGKTFQQIINEMPEHRVYIESHLGGGAVLRNKKLAAKSYGIEKDERVCAQRAKELASANVEILNKSAEEFLSNYPFVGDELVYVDPPYVSSTRARSRVYKHDYTEEQHEHLLAILLRLPCMVIVSGYDNPIYAKALSSWRTKTFQAKTHSGLRTESLWMNFLPRLPLHDTRYMGSSFREREVIRRRLHRLKQRLSCMHAAEREHIRNWLNEDLR